MKPRRDEKMRTKSERGVAWAGAVIVGRAEAEVGQKEQKERPTKIEETAHETDIFDTKSKHANRTGSSDVIDSRGESDRSLLLFTAEEKGPSHVRRQVGLRFIRFESDRKANPTLRYLS